MEPPSCARCPASRRVQRAVECTESFMHRPLLRMDDRLVAVGRPTRAVINVYGGEEAPPSSDCTGGHLSAATSKRGNATSMWATDSCVDTLTGALMNAS